MNDLRERLDDLAHDATRGLIVENPSVRATRGAGGGVAWAMVAAAAIVIAGVVAFLVARDDSPGVVTTADQPEARPAIFERARTPADQLPDYYVATVGVDYDVDVDDVRAGPSVDGYTIYVLPRRDGNGYCTLVVPDTEEIFRQSGSSGGCNTFATLAAVGPGPSMLGSGGVNIIGGVVTPDVIDVRIDGLDVILEDDVFIASGFADPTDVEFVREPERQALFDACAALGPLITAFESVGDLSGHDADALVTAAGASVEPSFTALADVLEQASQEIPFAELTSMTDLGMSAVEAADACAAARVPGWTVAYQPPTGRPTARPVSVDLADYGVSQQLLDTTVTSSAKGPGLGPVTRAAIEGTDVSIFWWHDADANILSCVEVKLAAPGQAGSSGICQLTPPDRKSFPLSTGLTVLVWRAPGAAAFATARIDDTTWVQEVRTPLGFVAFALPGEPEELLAYRSDGTIIDPSEVDAFEDAVEEQLPAGVIETWVNQTGMRAESEDVWWSRLQRACNDGVWMPDVAQALAIEFIEADGAEPEIDLQEQAASALWLMAIQVCQENFPEDEIAGGPFFDFRD